jgi:hypothetical protein
MTDRAELSDRLDDIEASLGVGQNYEPIIAEWKDPDTGEVSTRIVLDPTPEPDKTS